jgi:hypothetical protein
MGSLSFITIPFPHSVIRSKVYKAAAVAAVVAMTVMAVTCQRPPHHHPPEKPEPASPAHATPHRPQRGAQLVDVVAEFHHVGFVRGDDDFSFRRRVLRRRLRRRRVPRCSGTSCM